MEYKIGIESVWIDADNEGEAIEFFKEVVKEDKLHYTVTETMTISKIKKSIKNKIKISPFEFICKWLYPIIITILVLSTFLTKNRIYDAVVFVIMLYLLIELINHGGVSIVLNKNNKNKEVIKNGK